MASQAAADSRTTETHSPFCEKADFSLQGRIFLDLIPREAKKDAAVDYRLFRI
jgi:hypothetical protein